MTQREPEWAMVTVMFVDIRGFTSFADRSTARDAVEYLNRFFASVIPVIEAHGGSINKLLGDGLMAVFDAPDHADRALSAARDLIAGLDGRYRIGIGVNSGLVLMATMGAGDAVELGVVGDPVNVAARVQDATRDLGEPLLLTEATRVLLEGDGGLESRGTINLRGKPNPVPVYAVALPERMTRDVGSLPPPPAAN
jgi:adenylate cyclase